MSSTAGRASRVIAGVALIALGLVETTLARLKTATEAELHHQRPMTGGPDD